MVPRSDRRAQIVRLGVERAWHRDLYHRALRMPWSGFLGLAALVFLGANVAFALLYLAQPGSIANARPGSFLDAFFFSVETFATIGYGVLAPATVYANTIMTVETLVGIMLVALTTGVMFARVSHPTARVMFARVAVIAPYRGTPTLMVRIANERTSRIIEAEASLTLVRNERTAEGYYMRRFYDLRLERSHTPIFGMTFQVMHRIDPESPLYGETSESLAEAEVEIVASVIGLEETMAQTVHARASYVCEEVLFGHRYVDIFGFTEDGRRAIDMSRFHAVERLADSGPQGAELQGVELQGDD
jgi:inward rectifier potassium channel